MPQYTIESRKGKTVICEQEQPVSDDVALALLSELQESYPKPACVYLMYSRKTGLYKIGMTSAPIQKRLSQVRWENQDSMIEIVTTIDCDSVAQAFEREAVLHGIFDDVRADGEWFSIGRVGVFFFTDEKRGLPAIGFCNPAVMELIFSFLVAEFCMEDLVKENKYTQDDADYIMAALSNFYIDLGRWMYEGRPGEEKPPVPPVVLEWIESEA